MGDFVANEVEKPSMILKVLVALYIFTTIVFFDNFTIVPKVVGVSLSAMTLSFMLIRGEFWKLPRAILVMGMFVIHAAITLALITWDELATSFQTFLLLFGVTIFLYQALRIVNSVEPMFIGFLLGALVNLFVNFFIKEYDQYGQIERVNGTLGNANYYGFILNISVIIYFLYYKLYKLKSPPFLQTLLFIGLVVINILSTGSKTNMILTIFVLTSLWIGNRRGQRQSGKTKGIWSVIFLSFLVAIIAFLGSSDFIYYLIPENNKAWDRIDYLIGFFTGSGRVESTDRLRLNMFLYGIQGWTESPFFGHGFDSYTYLSPFQTYSHNNISELLFNSGIYGFTLFYGMHLGLYLGLKRKFSQNKVLRNYINLLFINFIFMDMSSVQIDDKLFWIIIITFTALVSLKIKIKNENKVE